MKEELLHTIWKLKRFNLRNLKLTTGEEIKLIKFGHLNSNAGPDFLNGEIMINNTRWVGHIEMHVKSSEWTAHNHHKDPAYNNVILHVVFEDDKKIFTESGHLLPTLVLENRIGKDIINNYSNLYNQLGWVPCHAHIHKVDFSKLVFFKERLLIERLENKYKKVLHLVEDSNADWDQVAYKLLVKYLGLKVNQDAFDQLSQVLKYKILSKHKDVFQLEALLFGQAGFLKRAKDPYLKKLRSEYRHQRTKHKLKPMYGLEWRFARMRPINFPTIRLAQLAQIISNSPRLFSKILSAVTVKEFRSLLSVTTSNYWMNHYIPNRKSKRIHKTIGKVAQNNIILNAFIPLIFCYGKYKQDDRFIQRALDFYMQLPSEKNVIIRNWADLGIKSENAADSQSLIQLKTEYCLNFKCLNCYIGQRVLFTKKMAT